MKNFKKNNKAITLIALVITVVVLVIIGGVAVGLTIGENGILAKAKQATEKHRYEDARERILIKIAEIKIKCQEEGRICTLEDIYEGFAQEEKDYYVDDLIFYEVSALRKNVAQKKTDNNDKTLKQLVVSHSVAEEYKFLIDGEGQIQGIAKSKKADDTEEIESLTYIPLDEFEKDIGTNNDSYLPKPYGGKVEPSSWTNEDVTIILPINAKYTTEYQIGQTLGDTWLTYDDNNKPTANENTTVYYRYTSGELFGQYNSFEIRNIDKDPPTFLDNGVTINSSKTQIVISAEATDGASGVEEFNYSLTPAANTTQPTGSFKDTATIIVSDYGTYQITVSAVDKAGNSTTGEKSYTKTIKVSEFEAVDLGNPELTNYYGYVVNGYTPSGGGTWHLFYANNKNAYLLRDSIGYQALSLDTTPMDEPGISLNSIYNNGGFFTSKATQANVQATRYMTNPRRWTAYSDMKDSNNNQIADWAMGGLTIEMFKKSYDATHVGSEMGNLTVDYEGYMISNNLTATINQHTNSAIYKNIYNAVYNSSSNYGSYFKLASPSTEESDAMCMVGTYNIGACDLSYDRYDHTRGAYLRPLVSIPRNRLNVDTNQQNANLVLSINAN